MYIICKYNVASLSAILVLQNTKIYTCTFNSGNVSFQVEALVNELFGFCVILKVLNVDLYYSYV